MRAWTALVFALFWLGLSGEASGHSPNDLELAFDWDTHILSVHVDHRVKDAGKHYVDKITVAVNGRKVVEQTFRSQVDRSHQDAVFKIIDVEPGDAVKVTAGCSISGKKSRTLTLSARPPEKDAAKTPEANE